MNAQYYNSVATWGVAGLAVALAVSWLLVKAGFPLPDRHRRSGNIDGLRGYLALLVMVHHFGTWTVNSTGGGWDDPASLILRNFGVISVFLFFMITGYLFFPKICAGFRQVAWRKLYISRVFRILPLQAFVVFIVSVIALIAVRFDVGHSLLSYPLRAALWMTSFSTPKLFGYEQSGLINASVLWSLKYEWYFYLGVMPVMAAACSTTVVRRRPVLIPISMALIGVITHYIHPLPIFLDSLPVFAVGILATLITNPRIRSVLSSTGAGALATAGYICVLFFSDNPLNPLVLIAVGAFFICITAGNKIGGLVSIRPAVLIGEISFGIYMLHGIVLYVYFNLFEPHMRSVLHNYSVVVLPLLMLITVLIAVCSHIYLERPLIAFGQLLANRKASSNSVAEAPETVIAAP